ncbi:hypothetical protein QAD02_015210 [Eretmocerus hayati]|uniref:Uncharacterized protein n=1 Tax=Eretmocerus hayati TaxID=131215 RepID=A0ACC2P8J3_9HYME|nr:hypothetical protein QAD02_015210 [Eretmocerus hayati]
MGKDEEIGLRRPEEYLIRDCPDYDREYYECHRVKGRFHQLFIHGEYLDCNPWNDDYKRCQRWKKDKDVKALEELVESERKRKFERLKGHFRNDVWKRRDKPPENWNAPLPDWMEERNKNTYLQIKARDIKNGTVNDIDLKIHDACTIL